MKKAQVLWLIFGAVALLFLIGAATVQPGRPISQYPRVTVLQGTDIFPIARTNVTPATNMGVTGFVISNYVVSIATGAVEIVAGTNVIITSTTNSTGGQTHTIAVTNTGSGADGVWTNNAGVIHPKVSNGQQTNSIQIYTNGAIAAGLGTLPYWGVPVAGETLVSLRDTGVGDLPWNEIFIGVRTGANLFWQNNFVEPSVNRRTYAMEQLGLRIDEYMTSDSNFVYRAFNTNGLDIWHFTPSGAGASNDTRYTFNSTGPVDASDPILAIQNSTTNKLTVYGGAGNVDIVGQITNQFLTAEKIVLTDAGKGLVSSAFGETNLQQFATTNFVNGAISNATLVGDNLGNHIATNRLFLSTNGQVIGSLPALSFANDPSVGLQWESADVISFNALPSTTFRISGGGAFVSSTVKFQAPQTGFGDPGYTFTTDIDTGLRNRAAGVIDVMSDNAIVFSVNQAAMEMFAPFTNNVVFRGGLQPWRFETNNNFEVFTNRTFFAWTGVAIEGVITLPNASTCSNFICIIKDQGGNATATNITISGVGLLYTNLIDGATTIPLDANFEAIRIYSSGRTNWYTF